MWVVESRVARPIYAPGAYKLEPTLIIFNRDKRLAPCCGRVRPRTIDLGHTTFVIMYVCSCMAE